MRLLDRLISGWMVLLMAAWVFWAGLRALDEITTWEYLR